MQVELAGRGTMQVREIPIREPNQSQDGVVLLLHGWGVTADVNFSPLYQRLTPHWRLIAPDQRGHGGGIRSAEPFSLATCAEDAADLIRHLELPPVTVLGYSMGGPIALLLARDHPELVRGLVLWSTAPQFTHNDVERSVLGGIGTAGELCVRLRVPSGIRRWARPLSNLCQIMRAGGSLSRFSAAAWLTELRVPTVVVVTAHDHLVSPADQHRLADLIPGAQRIAVPGDHDVCLRHPELFAEATAEALTRLAKRGSRDGRAA